MRYLLLVLLLLTFAGGCATNAPPNLTPQATKAWQSTQVIKAIDLLRDTAIAAQAATPSMLSEATTRKVVLWHQSALEVAHAAPMGWQKSLLIGLDSLTTPLSSAEKATLAPYVALIETVLKEVLS